MKYTIPYEDKISIPHIKELLVLDIKTGDIYQEDNDLVGKVIVNGEYELNNSEDVMEFSHEIPISLLVDDNNINPKIEYSNLEYEVVKGRGIELMFDLDVTIADRSSEEFQEEMDQKLSEVLDTRKDLSFKEVNEEINVFDLKEEEEELGEVEGKLEEIEKKLAEEKRVEVEQDQKKKAKKKAKKEKSQVEEVRNDKEEETEDLVNYVEEVEEAEVPIENEVDTFLDEMELEDESITVSSSNEKEEFNIGLIGNVSNDKYTTYKVLMLEDGEIIDEVLEQRQLSKDLLCNEYDYDGRKFVLKIKDE